MRNKAVAIRHLLQTLRINLQLNITRALSNLMAFAICTTCAHAETAPSEEVVSLNNSGVKKMNSGNLKGAVRDFNEALKIQPDYSVGYRNKFITYYKMKNYKSMIDDFEALQEMNYFEPNSVYMSQIGDAYVHQGLTRQKAGDLPGALENFDKANMYAPGTAEFLHYRGVAKKAVGDIQGANEDFEMEKQSESIKSRVRR
jgi:tetratricopeptide (TPR) repeat protein